MLWLIKKPANYAFGIMPLAAIILIVNLKKPADYLISRSGLASVSDKETAIQTSNIQSGNLPCGFRAIGPPQLPQKPTFVTNGAPVLQCPAGNYAGTTIQAPDAVYSASKTDKLILQADGNLVIYCVSCYPYKPLWSTQTKGKGGQALFFQTDGDLVLRNAKGKIIWHSNIHSNCSGSDQAYFTLQDDGNLVMLYNQTVHKPASSNPKDNITITEDLGATASSNDLASPHPAIIK